VANQSLHFDVTIIGAGPAGTVAAVALARRGHCVALIEQHRFPRDKVCGECVSGVGIEVLERLGCADQLRGLKPSVLNRTIIHAADGASLEVQLPRPMWGLSRLAMDDFLLNAAREAGAVILQPTRCEQLAETIQIRDLADNSIKTLAAKFVLLADGKGLLLHPRPAMTGDFGVKCHLSHVAGPRDAVELFGLGGHYGGLAPIENDQWNVAFSVPGEILANHQGNLDEVFDMMLSASKPLRRRLQNARRCGQWLTSPLPRFGVRRRWPKNVIPLGNAAAAMEPVGGEGMGLAMRSAELAAEAISASLLNGHPLNVRSLRRQFDELWRVRRIACRAVAMGISRPAIAAFGVRAAEACGTLTNHVFRMMKGEAV